MLTGKQIYKLQLVQLEHDEKYHKDVVILPLAERVKHMALHNAKYTAYFIEAVESSDARRMERVLTDAFIITLATANTLNQDLELQFDGAPNDMGQGSSREFAFIKSYAKEAGALAKYCEAWDHLENYAFREAMQKANLGLLKLIVSEATARALDLPSLYRLRLENVETRSIFNRAFKGGA